MCCRAVAAVTNLPGPPDGNRSKVTELRLDKHRSPASISYPVHFGNTWLFLATLDQRKNIEAEGGTGKKDEEAGGEEGLPRERLIDECAGREIAAGGGLRKVMEERVSMSKGEEECRTRFNVLRGN